MGTKIQAEGHKCTKRFAMPSCKGAFTETKAIGCGSGVDLLLDLHRKLTEVDKALYNVIFQGQGNHTSLRRKYDRQ